MQLPDVNILIYAFREGAPEHSRAKEWLTALLSSQQSFAVSGLVLSAFLRITTNPRVFKPPVPSEAAWRFVNGIRGAPGCVPVEPGSRHWVIFSQLCEATDAQGNQFPDAYLAALAIETGSEFVTTDRGFARFPGLRWHNPFT